MFYNTFVFVILLFTFHGIKCGCDANFGPAGSNECVLVEDYHQYQWASCKTDAYLKRNSNGRHICEHSDTYCYYQCNLEVNDIGDPGEVLPNCLCDPVNCTSPDGTDCNWYANCLEKRYPCKEHGEVSYATDYGLKYCELYMDHYQSFSKIGKRWVDAVRICLQKRLASVLNPNSVITCQGIQDVAIRSHHGCYFNHVGDSPSFCDISFADWAKVFWTIKGGFTEKATMIPMLKSMSKLPKECQWHASLSDIANTGLAILKIRTVYRFAAHIIGKRSLDKSSINKYDRALQMSELLSMQMHWNETGINWFAYPENGSLQSRNQSYNSKFIILMLASKADYDLNADPTTVSVNMTKSVADFEYSLINRKISYPIDGLQITGISTCQDISCSSTGPELEINFSKPQSSPNSKSGIESIYSTTTTVNPCNEISCNSTDNALDINISDTQSSDISTIDLASTTTIRRYNDTVYNSKSPAQDINQTETESSDILTSNIPYDPVTNSTVSPCNEISCSSY